MYANMKNIETDNFGVEAICRYGWKEYIKDISIHSEPTEIRIE